MGNWIATIEGIGPHHNNKYCDVETLTGEFIKLLKKEGHNVIHVGIVAGAKAEVKKENSEK